ncbi:bifunctional transcriptional activator/DNA repair enzyme protein Ada, partial [Planococcus sp. SIMBA_160]
MHRRRRVTDALDEDEAVTHALYGAGFGSSGRFYAESKALLGMTPTRYRRGGDGETVRFAIAETSLGPMLAAATAVGVCAIQFG